MEWTAGAFTLNPGSQLSGTGLYRINGGTVVGNTDLAVGNLDLVGIGSVFSSSAKSRPSRNDP